MTRAIRKYPVNKDAEGAHAHEGATFLHFGLDAAGKLCIWQEVETTKPAVEQVLYLAETDGAVPDGFTFLGSCVVPAEGKEWHLYVRHAPGAAEATAFT